MSTIQLELPDTIREFVEQEAAKAGFPAPEDYIQSVLRELQMLRANEDQDIEAALLEGLDSPARELPPEEWADMRREALQRLAVRSSS